MDSRVLPDSLPINIWQNTDETLIQDILKITELASYVLSQFQKMKDVCKKPSNKWIPTAWPLNKNKCAKNRVSYSFQNDSIVVFASESRFLSGACAWRFFCFILSVFFIIGAWCTLRSLVRLVSVWPVWLSQRPAPTRLHHSQPVHQKKSSTFAKFQAKKIPRGPLPRVKVRNRSFTWWDGIRIFIQRNLCKTAYWWQRRYFSDRYFARFVIFCDKIHSRWWQSIKIKDQSQVKRNTSYT